MTHPTTERDNGTQIWWWPTPLPTLWLICTTKGVVVVNLHRPYTRHSCWEHWCWESKSQGTTREGRAVMGGREGLKVGWVVERNWKSVRARERLIGTEIYINVKYFTNISSVKHFTLICLGCIVCLKIFYLWQNVLLQNKHRKIWKYFPANILHQNKRSVKYVMWLKSTRGCSF